MRRPLLACLVLSVSLAAIAPAGAAGLDMPAAPETVRPLMARWWQWRLSLPEMATPDRDPAGHFCDAGQHGDVWFLAGHLSVGGGSARSRRTCVVPTGTKLFFPVVTLAKFVHGGVTCDDAKAKVAAGLDATAQPFAILDGTHAPDLANRRLATQDCIPLTLAPGSASGAAPAAIGGVWMLLDPLPAGRHALEYGTHYKADSKQAEEFQDTDYDLEVK